LSFTTANLNLQTANNDYHIGIFGYALMLIECLKISNEPHKKLIERSLLSNFDLKNPDRFVPLFTIYEFLGHTSKFFQSKDTHPNFFQNMRLCNLGNTGKLIYSSSNVLSALQNLDKYDKYFCTNQSIELLINDSSTSIKSSWSNAASKGAIVMEYIWLCMLKNLLSSTTNDIWEPIEVHFMSDRSSYETQVSGKNTNVKFNQEQTAIIFKSSLLTKKLVNSDDCFNKSVRTKAISQRPPVGLAHKIEHFFDNNLAGYLPTLSEMAVFYGVSPSTFKRHLGYENSNYKDITNRWRLMNSVSLLTNTNKSVTEISNKLHYSNPANFIRAFKKWTGQTPMDFKNSS
jgi:AraC-like DNA-binding protein